MKILRNNFAFIDSQNVNLGIQRLGWRLDFKKFKTYLEDKFGVIKAYLFLGYLPEYEKLYGALRSYGYDIVFKPVVRTLDDGIKGNIDAELVLQAMIDYQNYDQAILATGDGDFYCLVKYLLEKDKLETILIPDQNKFSQLLKTEAFRPHRQYLNQMSNKLRLH